MPGLVTNFYGQPISPNSLSLFRSARLLFRFPPFCSRRIPQNLSYFPHFPRRPQSLRNPLFDPFPKPSILSCSKYDALKIHFPTQSSPSRVLKLTPQFHPIPLASDHESIILELGFILMGNSSPIAPPKAPKSSNPSQDQPPASSSAPAAAAYPEWASFQAYSPVPHGFFPSPVGSSPQAHPYMWGPQHMMPYGTPPPYVMYPPGGIYAHPSVPPGSLPFSPYAMPSTNVEVSVAPPGGVEVDGKSPDGKERSPLKSSKGSLGSLNMITGKNNNDAGKTSGASANGGFSQSGESGSEASSEGSDANSQNDSQAKTSGGQDSYDEGTQNGNRASSSRNGVTRTPSQSMLNQAIPIIPMPGTVAGPTTNLNIGMDYWPATAPTPIPPIRAKAAGGSVSGAMVPGAPSEWIQDERELKRQRRKQSNRESARRSRLRKQAECEELAQRVEDLKRENASLVAELSQIRKEYDQLLSQNTSLKEKLGVVSPTEASRPNRNGQHSVDNNHRVPSDSEIQASGNNTAESGH